MSVLLGGDDEIDFATVADLSATRSYDIQGMTCEGCTNTIRVAIEEVAGVDSAEVSYENKTATVYFSTTLPPADDLIVAAVQNAGYGATPQPTQSSETNNELHARGDRQ